MFPVKIRPLSMAGSFCCRAAQAPAAACRAQIQWTRAWLGGITRAMGAGFLKTASWLGPKRVGAYLRLLAMLNLAQMAWLVMTSHGGVDRNGFLLGSDFLSFWTTGRMLAAGTSPYDVTAHIAAQQAYFAQAGMHTAFFYPPPFLLACQPLGLLPYFPALAAWLAITGAACFLAVAAWRRSFGPDRPVWLLFAAFPPVVIAITHGQTAFMAAALIGGGALLVGPRPWLAGCLFGLAVFKPQLGLLIPVVLLAAREGRPIVAAALAALVLCALTTLAYGPQVWVDWLAVSRSAGEAMASGTIPFAKMVSLFAALRLVGLPAEAAMIAQMAVSLAVAGTLAMAGWRRGHTPALAAAMLAGAPLATPFVLDYDLVLLGFPLLWLATRRHRPWERIVTGAVFIAPAFARPLALEAGVPIMAPLMCVLFVLLARRALENPTSRE